MFPTLTFDQRYPHYQPRFWDKRKPKDDLLTRWARSLKQTLLPSQHARIMSGELLRGVSTLVETVKPKPRPVYTVREAELLRHLGEGMKLVAISQGGWRLTKGNRKTKARAKTVEALKERGLIFQHPLSKNWLVKEAAA